MGNAQGALEREERGGKLGAYGGAKRGASGAIGAKVRRQSVVPMLSSHPVSSAVELGGVGRGGGVGEGVGGGVGAPREERNVADQTEPTSERRLPERCALDAESAAEAVESSTREKLPHSLEQNRASSALETSAAEATHDAPSGSTPSRLCRLRGWCPSSVAILIGFCLGSGGLEEDESRSLINTSAWVLVVVMAALIGAYW